MKLVLAGLCYLAGAVFAALGLFVFATKATSILKPDVIGIVVIAALAVAAAASFKAAGRCRAESSTEV